MDVKENFYLAADLFLTTVSKVPEDKWDLPGLGSWSIRSLVGHGLRAMTTILEYQGKDSNTLSSNQIHDTASYFVSANINDPEIANAIENRGVQAGLELGTNPLEKVSDAVLLVKEFVKDAPLDLPIVTRMGDMTLETYLPTRTFELSVHSIDIATALGEDLVLAESLYFEVVNIVASIAKIKGEKMDLVKFLTGRIANLPRPVF
ncbi:MAG: hypothetical protein HKL80_11470 [Acidimicrobiales bacterium]|nr:hypothetical protein [Acidimicrobiales bacterium]